jgi:hypothetical protein
VDQQVGVDGQVGGVAERRHATDRVAGDGAHGVGVHARALRTTSSGRQLALVELVGAADVGEHDLAVDGEDQALHDLPDVDPDRRRGIGRGLGAIGEADGLDLQAGGVGGGDPLHVGMGHGSGTVAGPPDASTRDPTSEHAAATRYDER